jgi:hypothetical protein
MHKANLTELKIKMVEVPGSRSSDARASKALVISSH